MLTPNTQAILLLTAPLLAGRNRESDDLLKPSEYRKLAVHLRQIGQKPADLLAPQSEPLLVECEPIVDKERLKRLLGRGFLLSQAVEGWQARAIWVLSRADAAYPQRWKSRLREDAPAILYGCGDQSLVNIGGLAVVGSREVDEALLEYSRSIGELAALSRRGLLSGGARGVDQTAMTGALEAGGRAVGVLADSLERAALKREHRDTLLERRLVLVSTYDPRAGFHVGHAMQRNKLIYALADAALVVNAEVNKGGTWAGACEQLEKLRLVSVYIRSTGEISRGLEALGRKGAIPWPNPTAKESFDAALERRPGDSRAVQAQPSLFDDPQASGRGDGMVAEVSDSDQSAKPVWRKEKPPQQPPREALFFFVRSLLFSILESPMDAVHVAEQLGITRAESEAWLRRLVEEGSVEKLSRPVRYMVRRHATDDPIR